MRTVDSWFSFESRCLLCGDKLSGGPGGKSLHIDKHIREGYLDDALRQIELHPIGFPGPPLGQQPCSQSPTSQG